jgi:amino acid adenylation domain-containing protein
MDLASKGLLPCRYEQEGLWLLQQAHGVDLANHLACGLWFPGETQDDVLANAFRRFVERHDELRTAFRVIDGRLRRTIVPAAQWATEIRAVSTTRPELDGLLHRLTAERLDPTGRTMRAWVIDVAADRKLLFATFHHTIFDGWSRELFHRQVAASAYGDGDGRGRHTTRLWDRRTEQTALAELSPSALEFCKTTMVRGAAVGRLPDLSETLDGMDRPARLETLRGTELRRIDAVADRHGVTRFVVVLAAVQLLQSRYLGITEEGGVVTAIAMNARPASAYDVAGMAASEAPLFMEHEAGRSVAEYLQAVSGKLRTLVDFRHVPFSGIQSEHRPAGTLPVVPDVGLSYLRAPRADVEEKVPHVSVLAFPPLVGSRRALTIYATDRRDHLDLRWKFDPQRISDAYGARMMAHLRAALHSLEHPRRQLDRIELPADAERAPSRGRVVRSATSQLAPRNLHAGFEAVAGAMPNAIAVRSAQGDVSYAELDAMASGIAHRLRESGVGPDSAVGVCAPSSPHLIAGLLGTLKAGGAYVPLDPAYPLARLRLMQSMAGCRAIVLHPQLPPDWANDGIPVVPAEDAAPTARIEAPVSGDETALAYILFTSGSTGEPKPVAMERASLRNLLTWQRTAFALPGPRPVLQFASIGFDVSIVEILSTLDCSGTLVVVEERSDVGAVADLIFRGAVQRMFAPPFVLQQIARHLLDRPRAAAPFEAISAGEQLEITDELRTVWGRNPDWSLENQYGPTETHVVTSLRLPMRSGAWPRRPSIGRPIDGAAIHVLDDKGLAVPTGAVGEIFVGGISVARGYLGLPRLTAERFVTREGVAEERLYRTGDVGRWLRNGQIEYLGRRDRQVKVRGYRVEPGEIEAVLRGHGGVADVIVDVRSAPSGAPRLVAYVVPTAEPSLDDRELRRFAEARLPSHMVPTAYVSILQVPLTPNGKVDRQSLPAPEAPATSTPTRPSTELETTIQAIWARLLRVPQFGLDDDFFTAGGDSLLAAEATALLRSSGTVDATTVRDLFAAPTVRELARRITGRGDASRGSIPRARRVRADA